jgi:hypothetical protein
MSEQKPSRWGRNIFEASHMARSLQPGALLTFHKVHRGGCWLRSVGENNLPGTKQSVLFNEETIFLFVEQNYFGGELTVLVGDQLFVGRVSLFTPLNV